jgi:signal transduction histidine kinase/ABC-type sugar transport system substrate-binding protein/AraC-like DNA-binding protein
MQHSRRDAALALEAPVSHTPRIGIQIDYEDPFWVQVSEVMWQRAQTLSAELVEIDVQESHLLLPDEQAEVVEDLIVQELDALICNIYPQSLLTRILDRGIPIIYVSEIDLRHPRFSSRRGLYDAAHMVGVFLDQRLGGCGTVLVVGGWHTGEDSGQSRLEGFAAALAGDKRYAIHHVTTDWLYEVARPRVAAYLAEHPDLHIDAIFGLSDSLALAARDSCLAQGRIDREVLILGINGDPLALAAIAKGRMTATVETDVDDLAIQAVDLAHRAARGEQLPAHFRHEHRLVTAETVAECAVRKMVSLATLPTRLIDLQRRGIQQRTVQLETNRAIDRQVGLILDEQQLSLAITALIRDSYSFDDAQFLLWQHETGKLVEVGGTRRSTTAADVYVDPHGPLAYALNHNQTVFIPDTRASHRFAHDPLWTEVRSRVVVPVHLGGQVIGLLDLHRRRTAHYKRDELNGLQLLADRLGISVRNAELYGQELEARAIAEKADRLKTMLLASVSHELRTPLNIILGYSRMAIDTLMGGATTGEELRQDLAQIYRSGEHLLRLINDLLDLSRAEVGELELLPETIDTCDFLEHVFRSSADLFGVSGDISWRLEQPPDLPAISADPVRLRQVLLNLLHNAKKFTERGQVTLGAAVEPPELHLWVADTGVGIPRELHDQIFEPFVSVGDGMRRREGIGLGLSITRRLVALHHGRLLVESQPGGGSTFHIYLPLPEPAAVAPLVEGGQRALLLLTAAAAPPASLVELAARRGLVLRILRPGDPLADVLAATRPAMLAWDLKTVAGDGWSIVQQLRAQPSLDQLPIMLYQSQPDAAKDVVSAPTGLLMKPLDDQTLIQTLNDLEPPEAEGSILVVEDDAQTRALHCRIVAAHFPNHRIRAVGDGRAALELLAHETPNLVVLDLAMPEVDGFAVLEELRASPRTAMVPVLVLSGRALSAADIRRLGEARVIFQTKEVLLEAELAESLRRTLERDASLPPHTSALVKRAIAFIQEHHGEPLARQQIADAVGVSKDYLGRIFHQELGLSPWEYLIRYRMLRAKELLRTTDYTIAEVAARVGFDTATYFSHIFHREVGCSPRAFRTQS